MGKERVVIALVAIVLFCHLPAASLAGEADVVGVRVTRQDNGTYSFSVTVRHGDEGWDHYADRWEITDGKGNTLGTRVLLHPHVGEQPFTRSLGGVEIPEDLSEVLVRAHDLVHGYGGEEAVVKLPED